MHCVAYSSIQFAAVCCTMQHLHKHQYSGMHACKQDAALRGNPELSNSVLANNACPTASNAFIRTHSDTRTAAPRKRCWAQLRDKTHTTVQLTGGAVEGHN